jgi:ribosomal protein S18 acetylase RimI-like enzyme
MVKAELMQPSVNNWEYVGAEIFNIEKAVFLQDAFEEKFLKKDLTKLETVLVILKDGERIIGFAYSVPETDAVARIVNIAILPAFQGKGHVSSLMNTLETELIKQRYKYFTESAMIDNGYAEKILKHYSSRIVETYEFNGMYGWQRYFKIRL